jgi:hypothetical protein
MVFRLIAADVVARICATKPTAARTCSGRCGAIEQEALEVDRRGPVQHDEPCRQASHAQSETGLDRPMILPCGLFAKNRHDGIMARLESESS